MLIVWLQWQIWYWHEGQMCQKTVVGRADWLLYHSKSGKVSMSLLCSLKVLPSKYCLINETVSFLRTGTTLSYEPLCLQDLALTLARANLSKTSMEGRTWKIKQGWKEKQMKGRRDNSGKVLFQGCYMLFSPHLYFTFHSDIFHDPLIIPLQVIL